jgi:aspartate/methionine/tyrosine aminotransferase
MALTSTHPSSLSTLYLTALLTSSKLPSLLALNTQRLTASYNVLTSFLRRHDIDFVVPTHGLFLFAKLARTSASGSMEEEDAFWRELEGRGGVKVAPGRGFNGVEKDGGWARMRFSVGVDVMEEVVEKLDEFFAKSE